MILAMLAGFALFALVAILILKITSSVGATRNETLAAKISRDTRKRWEAIHACRRAIERVVASPHVEHPDMDPRHLEGTRMVGYMIVTYADAKNSQGELYRTWYSCEVNLFGKANITKPSVWKWVKGAKPPPDASQSPPR